MVAVTKETVRIRDDHEKIKVEAARMNVDDAKTNTDATKIKAKLKLRKQAIKEAKYEDSIMMMDTLTMSLEDDTFYEEKKAANRLKKFGHSSSTE